MSAKIMYVAHIQKQTAQVEPPYGDEICRPMDNDRGDLILYYSAITDRSAYHARCLRIRTNCTVGLGFEVVGNLGMSEDIRNRFNVVNDKGQSIDEIMDMVCMDLETCGNGYLEVVRDRVGRVSELYHCPAILITARPEGKGYYYRNQSVPIPFPRYQAGSSDPNSLLHLLNYTPVDRYYGLPDWRGCLQDIELDTYATLYNQKFFLNSAIPDLAIVVEGGSFDEDTEEKIVAFFQTNIKGINNSHKTLYLPVEQPGVTVRFEKLAMDQKGKDGSFEKLRAVCRDNIISAHGVPSRLAGVMTSGQLGGGGEIEGQLQIFQEITIAPRQRYLETKLAPIIKEMGIASPVRFITMNTSSREPASTYYPSMVNAGILTVDEARDELDYGKMPEAETQNGLKPDLKLVQTLEKIRKGMG